MTSALRYEFSNELTEFCGTLMNIRTSKAILLFTWRPCENLRQMLRRHHLVRDPELLYNKQYVLTAMTCGASKLDMDIEHG
jgi:hypothetical protein